MTDRRKLSTAHHWGDGVNVEIEVSWPDGVGVDVICRQLTAGLVEVSRRIGLEFAEKVSA